MRRLAKQDRGDKVRSARDYQEVISAESTGFTFLRAPGAKSRITFSGPAIKVKFACLGFYLLTSDECHFELKLRIGSREVSREYSISSKWTRIALFEPREALGTVTVSLIFPSEVKSVAIWGIAIGDPTSGADSNSASSSQLTDPHLVPEAFFLDHDTASLKFSPSDSTATKQHKVTIHLKKCAYCQRRLPVDPLRLLQLAFHKHAAKKSGHQNECRACKKLRINDFFNPKRSSDQLHESSVITRERKLLLREPEILQEFKNRFSGEGFRSHIWKKFGKRCFKCKTAVALDGYELDHTRPLAYLWPLDEHATCLCPTCNNFKKHRFPVEFYNETQLSELSKITGLPLSELKKRSVNMTELNRIKKMLADFATSCDPRTFRSIANKVRELLPKEDLFALLEEKAPKTYSQLMKELAQRPDDEEDLDLEESPKLLKAAEGK